MAENILTIKFKNRDHVLLKELCQGDLVFMDTYTFGKTSRSELKTKVIIRLFLKEHSDGHFLLLRLDTKQIEEYMPDAVFSIKDPPKWNYGITKIIRL